jgi:predicted RecB family nuclease
MSAKKITADVLEAFLHCKYKAHLKEAGERGTRTDYEGLLLSRRDEVRRTAIQKVLASAGEGEVAKSINLTAAALKSGPPFILDALFEDDLFCLKLDGLKKVPGPSQLGPFHYVPVLFHGGEKIGREQRLTLELHGLLLAGVQGLVQSHGVVWHGKACRDSRLALRPGRAEQLLRQLRRSRDPEPPKLILNEHCPMCEFRQRCHEQAVREDNLSLLRGIGEKEARAYARKGVLALTQLAHTFRPRRKGKRAVQKNHKRHHALQALAIRDRQIYIFGTPEVPKSSVRIYLDVEGVPDEGFVYLIGLVVCRDGEEKRLSFWADDKEHEAEIFQRFLDEVTSHEDLKVFCYGGYERAFIKRMRKTATNTEQVDRVLGSLVNVLSVVYDHLYFPCYSNGLKDVAGCLGCSWTEPGASGLQSLVWRARWEATQAEEWRQKLLSYNLEDCLALKRVTELLDSAGAGPEAAAKIRPIVQTAPPVAWVEELDRLGTVTRRGKIDFFHADFEYINGCGRFDYQRTRVYVRTSKARKKARRKPKARVFRNRTLRVNQQVHILDEKCPSCGGSDVTQWEHGRYAVGHTARVKRSFDLVFTPGGIKRKIIEVTTRTHECLSCGRVFVPERYQRLAKHFHGLMSWAMYEHVAHRLSCPVLKEMLEEYFSVSVCQQELNSFKAMMARYYQLCYETLLAKILAGAVLHIDETEVKLRTGKAYVWVFATAEEVVYMLRPTREGDFLAELLEGFHGVLVSDFYAAYDAIGCPQQKCLIHLMRDMNQELLNNPFDAELQSVTGPFGTLLRVIVTDIDEHGLKRCHLIRHKQDVDRYFQSIAAQAFRSEAAEALRVRMLKNRDKLFTFIEHDGVGWNNNLAENAIRQFAYYREDHQGQLQEPGLKDYLVLLSLYQTCRYRGVSFLKFLLSRETDMETFCQGARQRRKSPVIEVYPEGVVRPDFGPPVAEIAKTELQKLQGEWDIIERVSPDGSVSKHDGEGGLQPHTLTFNGDALTPNAGWADPPDELKGRCRLSPQRTPRCMTFVPLDASSPLRGWKGPATPGIYELEGDVLRLCIPTIGNGRPTSFEAGKGNWVYTLRRKRAEHREPTPGAEQAGDGKGSMKPRTASITG